MPYKWTLVTHKDLCLCLRLLSPSAERRSHVSLSRLAAVPPSVLPRTLHPLPFGAPLAVRCRDGRLDSRDVVTRLCVWLSVTMHTSFEFLFAC